MAVSLISLMRGLDISDAMDDNAIGQTIRREGIQLIDFPSVKMTSPGQGTVAVLCSAGRRIKGSTLVWQYNIGDLRSKTGSLMTTFELGYAYPEGSVILLLNPQVSQQTTTLNSKYTNVELSISAQTQIVRIGKAKFYGICGAKKADGEPCKMSCCKNGGAYCYIHDRSRHQQYMAQYPSLQGSSQRAGVLSGPIATQCIASQAKAPDAQPQRVFTSLKTGLTSTGTNPATAGKIILSARPTFSQLRDMHTCTLFNPVTLKNQKLSTLSTTAADGAASLAPKPAGTKSTAPQAVINKPTGVFAGRPVSAPAGPPLLSKDVLGAALSVPVPQNKRPLSAAVSGQVCSLEDHDLDDASETIINSDQHINKTRRTSWEGGRDGSVVVPAQLELGFRTSAHTHGMASGLTSTGHIPASVLRLAQPKPRLIALPAKSTVKVVLASVDASKAASQNFKMVGSVLVDVSNLNKQSAGTKAAKANDAKIKPPPAAVKMSAEIESLLSRKSKHAEEADDEWFQQYGEKLDKMAKKESQQDHVNKQHALTVKAFFCKTCKIHTEHLPSLCRTEGHVLVPETTTKRFYSCKHCLNTSYTIGPATLPKSSCSKCGQYSWSLCGYQGKVGSGALTEKLVLAASSYGDRHVGSDMMNIRESEL